MTREELEAALDEQHTIQSEQWESYHADVKAGYMDEDTLRDWSNALIKHDLINAAARKQLALMPEKCGTCEGSSWVDGGHRGATTSEVCPTCHGSGKVYPPAAVEKIARTIYEADMSSLTIIDGVPVPNDDWDGLIEVVKNNYRRMAVAVLDALGETE